MRGFITVGSRLSLCLALLTAGSHLVQPARADDHHDRIDRQIRLFERVLDDVLVESPNFLVQSREVTLGRYREGEGAEFAFKTSLVGEQHHEGNWWSWFGGDRKVVVVDEDDWEDLDRDELEELVERKRGRNVERQERRYARGKEELVDALLDYGELLTAVADDETLTIRARLRRAEYFDRADLSRLTIRVRMGDLRAYLAGRLDSRELESRIELSES